MLRRGRMAVAAAMLLTASLLHAANPQLMSPTDPALPTDALRVSQITFSGRTSVSADGRYVVFTSYAKNLFTGQVDNNDSQDLFLYDRDAIGDKVSLVSRASSDPTGKTTPVTGAVDSSFISADGNWIVYTSSIQANLLLAGASDPNGGTLDVFLFDRVNGTTRIVSRSTAAATTTGSSTSLLGIKEPISSDGRYIAFMSSSTNLVAGVTDPNGPSFDLYLFDRCGGVACPGSGGAVTLVSHTAASTTTTGGTGCTTPSQCGVSNDASISADGNFIAYSSQAVELAAGQTDTNETLDVFLYDRAANTNTLVSHNSGGATTASSGIAAEGGAVSRSPSISGDGRFIAFESHGDDLIAGYTYTFASIDVYLFDRTTGANVLVSHAPGSAVTSGNNPSQAAVISEDGNWIAYRSHGYIVTPVVTNSHIYLYDRVGVGRPAGSNLLVSHAVGSPVDANGSATTAATGVPGITFVVAREPRISANGRYVAYTSLNTNLVAGQVEPAASAGPDPPPFAGYEDAFLWDRDTGAGGTNVLVQSKAGFPTTTGNGRVDQLSLSTDGSSVVYRTEADDLTTDQDRNPYADVYHWTRTTATNRLVSKVVSQSATGSGGSYVGLSLVVPFSRYPAVSDDGRYAVLVSIAPNLKIAGGPVVDRNRVTDVFLYDKIGPSPCTAAAPCPTLTLITHKTGVPNEAASHPNYETLVAFSDSPTISGDGRYVVYASTAHNLVSTTQSNDNINIGMASDVFLWDRDAGTGGTNYLISGANGSATVTANAQSLGPVISRDGAFIAFVSRANNLVAGVTDPNTAEDVFVRDRVAGTTVLVSHNSSSTTTAASDGGLGPNPASAVPAISEDGSYIAYLSAARDIVTSNLANDVNGANDLFLYHRPTNTNRLVSHRSGLGNETVTGNGGPAIVTMPGLSGNGQFVTYHSKASNLVAGQIDADVNGAPRHDVFLFDRLDTSDGALGSNKLVSHIAASAVTTGNGSGNGSDHPRISRDGNFVTYRSTAANLIPGTDVNGDTDVFLFYRNPLGSIASGTNVIVSRASSNAANASNGASDTPAISGDGRFIAFNSVASNLVTGQVPSANGAYHDVFWFDRATNTMILASPSTVSPLHDGNRESSEPVISDNGSTVTYDSTASNLVAGDLNVDIDAFLYSAYAVLVGPAGATTITEAAGASHSTTFLVTLSSSPSAPVTIPVTPSNAQCSSPSSPSIILDGTNWNSGVTVTIDAVDDLIVDGPLPCTMQLGTTTSADGNYNALNPNDVTVTVTDDDVAADVSVLSKTDTPDPVTPGANLVYTITVNNAGPSAATTVTLTDALPASTTFVSMPTPAGWTCTTPAAGATGSISCSIGVLTAGSTVFTVTVKVNPSAAPGSTIDNTATVASASSDPDQTNQSKTATTTVGAASADLTVQKSDTPDPVTPGANLTYTITLTNNGPSNASTVALNDSVPGGTTFVSMTPPAGWSCSSPVVGGTGAVSCTRASFEPGVAAFTMVVNVDGAAVPASTITNTASVTSTTADPATGNESDSELTTVASPSANLTIAKSDAPDPATAGGNLVYTISVENAGPSSAASVSLSDTLPAGTTFVSMPTPAGWSCTTPAVGANGTVSCSVASLPVGNTAFALTVKIDPAAAPASTLSNTASLSSTTTDPSPGDETATAVTTIAAGSADLTIAKSDSPDPVTAGSNITYTITLTNAGPSAASMVEVSDPLPAETRFVSLAAPAGWTCSTPSAGANGTVSCTIASLGVTNAVFTLVASVDGATAAGTVITNTATPTAATADPNTANDSGSATTTVTGSADLSIAKSDSPDPVTAGTNLTYTLTATNSGPSSATSVSISDTLPANTSFVSLSSPAGWSCTTPAVGANGTVTCSNASFAVGDAAFTLTVAVDPSVPAGTILSNTASISSATTDPLPGNESSVATTVVAASADLSLTKTDAPDPVTPGANLTYSITASNAGPSHAADVTLADTLPAGTTFVSLASPVGWTCSTPAVGSAGSVSCSAATLGLASAAFTLVVAVDPATLPATVISNTATVSAATTDPNSGNDSASSSTTAGASSADLSVAKVDTPDPVTAGGNLTYTITVNNAGPSHAANVTLADTLPAETTFVSLAAPAGWTCTTPAAGANGAISCTATSAGLGNSVFTLVVNVLPATATGTPISNTATVSSSSSDPNTGNESGSSSTQVGVGSADLSVTNVDAPDPVTPGGNLTYTITVTNAGPSNATTASFSDTIPANTTFVSLAAPAGWSCTTPPVGANGTVSCSAGTMPAGAAVFTLVVQVNAGAAASTVSNTATASSATTDPNSGNDSATATTTVAAGSADLSVSIGDSPDPVTPGTNLTFSLTVNNAGPSNGANVSLSDTLPAGTTFVSLAAPAGWSCTTPAAGSGGAVSCSIATLGVTSGAFTLVVAVDPATAPATVISNTATVATAASDPNSGNDSASSSTTVGPRSADLSIAKLDTPDPVTAGTNLTYTITAGNAGPSHATNVTLSDALPTGTTFVSLAAPAGWSCTAPAAGAGGSVTCSISGLALTEQVFTLVVAVPSPVAAASILSNTATVSASSADPNSGNESATATTAITTSADVSTTVTDTPDPIAPDSDLTYTITVFNAGPSDAATVQLTDTLPAGTTFVSLGSPAGWSCSTPPAGNAGTISCSVASLGLTNAAFTLVVHVGSSVAPSTILSNTATAASTTPDPNGSNDAGSATTTVVAADTADVFVTITDTPDPVAPNASLTYTINVANAGPATAASVHLSLPQPANTTFVSFTPPGGWTCSTPPVGGTGTIACDAALLTVSTATFTFIAHVDASAVAASVLSSTATVTSATVDAVPGNETATAQTTIAAPSKNVAVTGTKSVTGSFVSGGAVTYTIVLTNGGTETQPDNAGHELTDVLDAALNLVSASATSGTATATAGTRTVTWNGSIAAGGSVTITIHATIAASTAVGTSISNQGSFAFDSDGNGTNESSGVTDDTRVGGSANPTVFVVGAAASPANIPTASDLALAALAALLVAVALMRMR